MRRSALLLSVATLLISAEASAKKGIFHRISPEREAYADIADHYYGRRHLERHLRLFNRRPEPLRVGTTIIIPTYQLVPVKRGQSLEEFAAAHLNDPQRANYLALLHNLRGRDRRAPRPGRRLRVVQSLSHTVRRGETLRSIAQLYYREAGSRRLQLLVLYNKLTDPNVRPGSRLRIPLDTPVFSHDAVARRAKRQFTIKKEIAVEEPPPPPPSPPPKRTGRGKSPARQERAERRAVAKRLARSLEQAERLYGNGEYGECEKITKGVLGAAQDGSKRSRVEILRLLAFSQIAQGEYQDAKGSFKALLDLDPSYELDLYRTSPKILDIFEAVALR